MMVEKETGMQIKCLRSDGGGKYFVGIRVKVKHRKLEEEETQAHNTKVYYLVCKYKDKVSLE